MILAKVKGPSPPPPISRIPSTSSQSSLNDSSEEQTFEAAMKAQKNLVESHEGKIAQILFSYATSL